jgi:2-polyprenyl-6-methoxyphenol hydroxylase-like FAD-dependent oxidoreductase
MTSLRILIVGGGIAGLALGRALRERQLPEIVERAASWSARGTGLYIPGNGVRALGGLGLADTVLARAVCMSHQRILSHKGRQLAEVRLPEFWGGVGPCVGIARDELHRILLDGADGVPRRLGATVTALSQRNREVDVAFADGSTGTYDLVVGADGIHSATRRLVFGDMRPRYLGQVSWRFLVEQSKGIKTWTAMLARDRAFLTVPVAPNRLYCYADSFTAAPEDPTGRDPGRLRALFADFAEPVPSILGAVGNLDSIHFSPIEEIVLDRSIRGRVVLIGDAAHATSPNMAEGASMALEDAVVLAEMLAGSGSVDEALSAFSERRRSRIRWVQKRTHRRDRIRAGPVWRRDCVLRCLGPTIYWLDYRPLRKEP